MRLYEVSDKFIGNNMTDEEMIELLKNKQDVLIVCFENDFNVSKLYVKLVNLESVKRVIVIGAKSKTTFGKKLIFSNSIKSKFFKDCKNVFFSIRTDIDEDVLKPIVDIYDLAKQNNCEIGIYEGKKDIIGNTYKTTKELEIVLKALSYDTLEVRYSVIYDYICNELDKKFQDNSICQFENDRCIVNRKYYNKDKIMGCCYSFKYNGIQFSDIKLCEHLVESRCTVKCLGCKLFTCDYLKKHGIRFSLENMSVAKAIFSKKQREVLRTTFFVDKPEVMKALMRKKACV